MKSLIINSILFAAAVTGVASAQETHANIPFAFTANGKTMAAGDYTVSRVTGNTYALRNAAAHESVLLAGRQPIAEANGQAKLVFNRALDGLYLTELWDGSMGRTIACPHSRDSFVAGPRIVIGLK